MSARENYRKVCKAYLRTPDKADILHAATCLQTDSILITNDRHFERIRNEGIIKVWSTTEAIRRISDLCEALRNLDPARMFMEKGLGDNTSIA